MLSVSLISTSTRQLLVVRLWQAPHQECQTTLCRYQVLTQSLILTEGQNQAMICQNLPLEQVSDTHNLVVAW